MRYAAFVILTILGSAAFVLGVVQTVRLRKSVKRDDTSQAGDPFGSSTIDDLFSVSHGNRERLQQQRRVIWMFCLAVLLLFLARHAWLTAD